MTGKIKRKKIVDFYELYELLKKRTRLNGADFNFEKGIRLSDKEKESFGFDFQIRDECFTILYNGFSFYTVHRFVGNDWYKKNFRRHCDVIRYVKNSLIRIHGAKR